MNTNTGTLLSPPFIKHQLSISHYDKTNDMIIDKQTSQQYFYSYSVIEPHLQYVERLCQFKYSI